MASENLFGLAWCCVQKKDLSCSRKKKMFFGTLCICIEYTVGVGGLAGGSVSVWQV